MLPGTSTYVTKHALIVIIRDVWLIIRQKADPYACGLSREKRDKFGLAICNHCSNEIKEKRWSPALRQLFTEQKPLFNPTFWQRYGFKVGWLSAWPRAVSATSLYFTFLLVPPTAYPLNIMQESAILPALLRNSKLSENSPFTRLLRCRPLQQIPEGFAAAIANPLVAFQIEMIVAPPHRQPHLRATAPDG